MAAAPRRILGVAGAAIGLLVFCTLSFGVLIADGAHLYHINSVGGATLALPMLQAHQWQDGGPLIQMWSPLFVGGGPIKAGVSTSNPLLLLAIFWLPFDQAVLANEIVLKLVGGLGALWLLRSLRLDAATVAAGVLILNGFHAAAAQDFSYSQPFFLIPWAALALKRLSDRPDGTGVALLVVVASLIYLTASIQVYAFIACFLLLPWGVLLVGTSPSAWPAARAMMVAGFTHVGMVLFDLFAQVVVLASGDRVEESGDITTIIRYGVTMTLVSLAFWTVLDVRFRYRRVRVVAAGLWLVSFLLFQTNELRGPHDIFVRNYFESVTIANFDWSQQLARYQFGAAGFLLLAIAAWQLAQGRVPSFLRVIMVGAAAYTLSRYISDESRYAFRTLGIPLLGIVVAQGVGLSALLGWVSRHLGGRRRAIVTAGLLALVSLDITTMYYRRTVFSDGLRFTNVTTTEQRFLASLGPLDRMVDVFENEHLAWKPLPMERASLVRHLMPMYWGVATFSRVGIAFLPFYSNVYHKAAMPLYYGADPREPTNPLLDLAGVGWVATNIEPPPQAGLERVVAGEAYSVWRNPRALPRVLLFSGAEPASDDVAIERLRQISARELGVALLAPERGDLTFGGPSGAVVAGSQGASTTQAGTAKIVSYQTERVEIEVDASRPALLVLNDAFAPGWKASQDGVPVPILRANVMFRGLMVPAGRHTVVMEFQPRWRRPVELISLAAAMLTLLLPIFWRRRVRGGR